TAVASLRIPEFDMQPEIAIFSVGDDVGTGMRAAQDAVFREPLIGAGGVPSSECFAIEDRHRAVPHRLSGAVKGGRLVSDPVILLAVGLNERADKAVALEMALHRQVAVFSLPLRRNGKVEFAVIEVIARDRSGAAAATHKSSHQHAGAGFDHFEP